MSCGIILPNVNAAPWPLTLTPIPATKCSILQTILTSLHAPCHILRITVLQLNAANATTYQKLPPYVGPQNYKNATTLTIRCISYTKWLTTYNLQVCIASQLTPKSSHAWMVYGPRFTLLRRLQHHSCQGTCCKTTTQQKNPWQNEECHQFLSYSWSCLINHWSMKLDLRVKGGIHLHSISHQIKVGHPADQVQSCGIKSYFRHLTHLVSSWNSLSNNNQEIRSWFLSSWNIPGHVSDIMRSPMQLCLLSNQPNSHCGNLHFYDITLTTSCNL